MQYWLQNKCNIAGGKKITENVLFYAAIRLLCGASSVTGDCGYTVRLATKRYVSWISIKASSEN